MLFQNCINTERNRVNAVATNRLPVFIPVRNQQHQGQSDIILDYQPVRVVVWNSVIIKTAICDFFSVLQRGIEVES